MDLSPAQCDVLMNLARDVIRRALRDDEEAAGGPSSPSRIGADATDGILLRPPVPHTRTGSAGSDTEPGERSPLDPLNDAVLQQPAGCFVSLHSIATRQLRGCVGRLDASLPLVDAIRRSAANVLGDPRFAHCRVCFDELRSLEMEISVVSPLRPAAHPLAFDPAANGIYLTIGERAGCFLPQVGRETGWRREQLLDRLCTEKMNLPAGRWRRPDARLSIFSARTIGPERF